MKISDAAAALSAQGTSGTGIAALQHGHIGHLDASQMSALNTLMSQSKGHGSVFQRLNDAMAQVTSAAPSGSPSNPVRV